MEKKVINFIGVLYSIRTVRDGGTRLTIDVGADGLGAIMDLQRANATGDICLAIAISPFENKDEFRIDP